MDKLKILYVDDEKANLINFSIAFKRYFTIFTADSGPAALEIFENTPDIAIVVADQRMPRMTGVELLRQIRRLEPDAVRIILTAYTDVADILDSINKGKIYHYIIKPWEEDELLQLLHKAGEMYLLTRENKRLLKELNEKNRQLESDVGRRKRLEAILVRRDMVLAAVNDMARALLLNRDWQLYIEELMGRMGLVMGVSRIHILQHYVDDSGDLLVNPRFRWVASEGMPPEVFDPLPTPLSYSELRFDSWRKTFLQGGLVCGNVSSFDEPDIVSFLQNYSIRSIAVAPIMVNENCWGMIGFEDCLNEREWPAPELDALKTAASLLGTAILRENVEQSLAAHQAQLAHAGRLTALGEMASGIGHEIHQPLTVINLGAETCKSYFDKHDSHCPAAEAADEMRTNVKKITNIINSMRSFSRASSGDWKKVSLQWPLQEAMTFFKEQFRLHMIEYSELVSPDLPLVRTDTQKFEQILVNLLSNARYAVDKKQQKNPALVKKITVSLHYEDITDEELAAMHFKKTETTSNQVVILEVKDNGIGMNQDVLKRCLEPFFTTKEVGEGTGLGLSVTHGIIRELNFHLAVESREGDGAAFRVVIPVEIADRIA
ncbi:MAG: response regulator [Proteobacteria bacterium]|nr:response regulator [Pseudomonadota bacterium]MBU4294483.1 response regulator [Pseudomonadota bacterium]MCG2749767.1 response regulator [Desulfobulbaceae bacterium]